jgi:acyl-CoA thioesterase-1
MIPLTVATGCGGDAESGSTASESNTSGGTAAVSSATAASSAPSLLPKVTVLFFGTSLTAGYGLDPGVAFPRLVETKAAESGMPIVAVNAGLSGETSAGAVRRIEWVLRQKADIVVIETGGNDALRALNADSLRTNLRAIVRQVKAAKPEARILLAVMEAPPNLGAAYTARFRQAYVDVAREEDLTLLPFLLDGVAGHPDLNQADGVHPNEKGERIVAGNVWRALEPAVAEVYREGSRSQN